MKVWHLIYPPRVWRLLYPFAIVRSWIRMLADEWGYAKYVLIERRHARYEARRAR